jgi:hypothetical protein
MRYLEEPANAVPISESFELDAYGTRLYPGAPSSHSRRECFETCNLKPLASPYQRRTIGACLSAHCLHAGPHVRCRYPLTLLSCLKSNQSDEALLTAMPPDNRQDLADAAVEPLLPVTIDAFSLDAP